MTKTCQWQLFSNWTKTIALTSRDFLSAFLDHFKHCRCSYKTHPFPLPEGLSYFNFTFNKILIKLNDQPSQNIFPYWLATLTGL